MMAPDLTPSPPTLEPETVAALRDELLRYSREGDHSHRLRDILCRITDEAHAKGMRAEQLLIALKQVWYSVVEATRPGSVQEGEQNKLLQRLVTRCIEQYYGE